MPSAEIAWLDVHIPQHMPLPIWRPEKAAYLQCDGPELRASTKPGFRTGLACWPLESSCRLPADTDRRASKAQFLKMSENRVRLTDSRSQRAVYCGSRHARRPASSHLCLAWVSSELPTRALRIRRLSNGVQPMFVLLIARRAAVWTFKTLV